MSLLREPKTKFQQTLRDLAEAAMSATHHDADPNIEIGAAHEVEHMERLFSPILRGYAARISRRAARHPPASPAGADGGEGA